MRKMRNLLFTFALLTLCLLLFPTKAQAASKSDLTFTLISSSNSYSIKAKNTDISGELIIPDSYNGKPVTMIPDFAFRNCNNITSVIVPDSVTTIGHSAFRQCNNLTAVTIADSVKSIDDYAFYDCKQLTTASIGNGVTTIGDYLFYDCINLNSVTIGSSVTTISYKSFYNCSSLTSVIIPDSVTAIEYQAFYKCSSLTSATIGNGVTTIASNAFYSCTNLTNLSIGNGLTSIENSAFGNCGKIIYNIYDNAKYLGNETNPYVLLVGAADKSITQCTIHPATKYIFNGVFSNCTSLTSITIPYISRGHLGRYFKTLIYDSSFQDYGDLSAYVEINMGFDSYTEQYYGYAIPKSLKTVTVTGGEIPSSGFTKCANLTEVILQDGVTSIGSSAFTGCTNLTDISIPDSLTSIGESLFSGCDKLNYTVYDNAYYLGNANNPYMLLDKAVSSSVTEIEIHSGTKLISNYTFEGAGLTKITLPDSVTFIGTSAFADCNTLTDVYYKGTRSQWNAINMSEDNGSLRGATLHFTLCATEHSWDSGIVSKPATNSEEGTKTYTCNNCGETKTEPIPTIPATTTPTKAPATAPVTTKATRPAATTKATAPATQATQATKPVATQATKATQTTKPVTTQATKPAATQATKPATTQVTTSVTTQATEPAATTNPNATAPIDPPNTTEVSVATSTATPIATEITTTDNNESGILNTSPTEATDASTSVTSAAPETEPATEPTEQEEDSHAGGIIAIVVIVAIIAPASGVATFLIIKKKTR